MFPNQNRAVRPDYLYRKGVGTVVINQNREILVGKRRNNHSYIWQMPQGGIEEGETEEQTVFRELMEEMNVSKASILAKSVGYYYYNIPYHLQRKFWSGKYIGQRQRWFLLQYLGDGSEIMVNTAQPEFSHFKWMTPDEVLLYVVPFKHEMYAKILAEFSAYLK